MIENRINISVFKTVIILITLITILCLSGYFSYTSYKKQIANLQEKEMDKLESIVTTLAPYIDGDKHQFLIEKYYGKDQIKTNEQDSVYYELHKILSTAKNNNQLTTDIYTIVIDQKVPKNSFFGVSSSNPYFRHSYTPPEITVTNYGKIAALEPYKDDHGTWISAFAPIKNSQNETVAIIQADVHFDEFIQKVNQQVIKELVTTVVLIVISLIVILLVLNYMLNRVNSQQKYVIREFSKLDELSKYIKEFLQNILNGNFEKLDNNFSDKENEVYKSLIDTYEKIAATNKKEHEQQWLLSGRGQVAELLQKSENIEQLGDEIIKFIVDYTNAVQGALYMYDSEKELVEMQYRYAYNRKKHTYNSFKIGEGLVGQCAYEKAKIYRTEIPEEYASITSGLITDKKPSSILIVPLLNGQKLLGIIEIASINQMSDLDIEFVEQSAIITSQTLFNILTNNQTQKFLDDALKMGKELQEQKIVLEQNAEEMKATQEELERSNVKLEEQFKVIESQQDRLHALLSQSEEIISIYDPMMTVKYKSPSVEHILGYKPEELIGKNDFKLRGNEGLLAVVGMFEKLMDHPDETQTIEYKCHRKDGSEVWLEATGQNHMNNSAIEGIIITTRDITERREAEKEQEMRAKMQALSENSQDIIMRLDLEGNFQYVNSRLRHYTGIFTRFTGKNFYEVEINPEIVRRWEKILKDIQKDPKLIQREMFFETEVDEFIMQVNAIPEFNKNDELESVLLVSHDITSRKKQEILIQDTNKKITDSINYARRIQNAIIPMEEELKKEFEDFMMFYVPKDVVSGDFPWYYKRDGYIYIAAVDCTGHGVPGAMMSLIGYLLLNDIVNGEELLEPSEVLLRLHRGVVQTLKQDVEGNNTSDGMDVALCRISLEEGEVQYSGAHRPLYLLRNNEIEQYKGSPFPIGGMQYRGRNKYKNKSFNFEKGDKIYFFSDGLPDQFAENGEDKYSPQRIRDMVIEHQDKSMKELENIFNEDLKNWMGEEKQLDDVLLMGISF